MLGLFWNLKLDLWLWGTHKNQSDFFWFETMRLKQLKATENVSGWKRKDNSKDKEQKVNTKELGKTCN